MIAVTHDMGVIRHLAVVPLSENGRIVESGLTDQILEDPQHAYTQQLVLQHLIIRNCDELQRYRSRCQRPLQSFFLHHRQAHIQAVCSFTVRAGRSLLVAHPGPNLQYSSASTVPTVPVPVRQLNTVNGESYDLASISDQIARAFAEHIGFVTQFLHCLPENLRSTSLHSHLLRLVNLAKLLGSGCPPTPSSFPKTWQLAPAT